MGLSSLLLLTWEGAIAEHHVFILPIPSPQEKMLSGLACPVKPHLPQQLFSDLPEHIGQKQGSLGGMEPALGKMVPVG